jgi:hypothetical protein
MVKKGQWQVIGMRRGQRIEARVFFSCRPLTGKRRKCRLCELCASSEAGGEKDFTGRFVPPRDLRFFRTAFFLLGSVPDPAAVSHSGGDSQLGEHPAIKNKPSDNQDDEEPEVFHDTSQAAIF